MAPLFAEREAYLSHLLGVGKSRKCIRNIATMLLNVVRLLKLDSSRRVGMDEIIRGCRLWVDDPNANRFRRLGVGSAYVFQLAATNWLRFEGLLITPATPESPYGDLLSEFLIAMRTRRGLASQTIIGYQSKVSNFLSWLQPRCPEFFKVRTGDIEEYLEEKRLGGLSRSSVATHCIALRTFFEYAEQRQWCSGGIRRSISRPRLSRRALNLSGPAWEDVRHVIASIGNSKPADLRAKAMILLLSVYGFRSSEVRGLTLEDIDWQKGSITVRRAKHGRTQQFPLQSEAGEAISQYLENARPKCSCRTLFVTLTPPYRAVDGSSMRGILNHRIERLGLAAKQFGPHMLRRACATKLLKTGSSLQEIADFLGHSTLQSVTSYAKFDPTYLRKVAIFSLHGIL
jgi:integrase/recombinase XerD